MRLALLFLIAAAVYAQPDPENFRIELTGSAWRTRVEGEVQSGGVPVDLLSDLALKNRWTFFGRLVVKPGRRHRLILEGAPYSFEGRNVLSRTILYAGRAYAIQEDIASQADLTYIFGGYQIDVVTRPQGHFGFQAGVAWIDAAGEISSVNRGVTSRHEADFPLPMVGVEGRGWLVPGRVSVSGEIKGMTLGPFGRYLQGGIHAGVTFGKLTFLAGWQTLDSDVHEEEGGSGIRPRIFGPMISLQLRH